MLVGRHERSQRRRAHRCRVEVRRQRVEILTVNNAIIVEIPLCPKRVSAGIAVVTGEKVEVLRLTLPSRLASPASV